MTSGSTPATAAGASAHPGGEGWAAASANWGTPSAGRWVCWCASAGAVGSGWRDVEKKVSAPTTTTTIRPTATEVRVAGDRSRSHPSCRTPPLGNPTGSGAGPTRCRRPPRRAGSPYARRRGSSPWESSGESVMAPISSARRRPFDGTGIDYARQIIPVANGCESANCRRSSPAIVNFIDICGRDELGP